MDRNLIRYNKNIKLTALDFETFNLNLSFEFNRPWQCGIIKIVGNDIIEEIDLRINWPDAPHLKIGEGAARITRYSQSEQDRLAIHYKEAFPAIYDAVEWCDYLIMHNGLRFDLYLLKDYYKMMGKSWKHIVGKTLDTNSIAKGIKLNSPFKRDEDNITEYQYRMSSIIAKGVKTNLTALGKEFGIEADYENLHSAIRDLELNKSIWDHLKFRIEL